MESIPLEQQKKTFQLNHEQAFAKMTGPNDCLPKSTLNIHGLNPAIKHHRLAGWIKQQNPSIYYLQETHLINKEMRKLRVKGWEKALQAV